MTNGKRVYPMMHIDWKKELAYRVNSQQDTMPGATHMFPPNSLICMVTTASPIHTKAKTPEKTIVFCLPDAVIDSSKLKRRQNINGPLEFRLE